MGHRIESGNAAINRELAQQGDAIAQVLRGIHVRPLPILLVFLTLRVVCSCVCVRRRPLGYQCRSSECAPQPGNT